MKYSIEIYHVYSLFENYFHEIYHMKCTMCCAHSMRFCVCYALTSENCCQAKYVASLDEDVLGSEVESHTLALSRQQVTVFYLSSWARERASACQGNVLVFLYRLCCL